MSKEIRAGIVGCGGIANSHVKGYLENEAVIAGGGCVLDTSSHSVDLFRFLFGEVVEQKSVTHAHFEGTDVEDAGIRLFLDAVAKGTEPAVTANDAVKCLEVIINAY